MLPYFQPSEFYYRVCDAAAHLSGRYILFFAFRPWIEMEDQMAQMASAPFLALCSLPTQTGQAEMRPASILICIYPADDPLLSVCRQRHKLHPS